jgi:hypothetical protein
VRALSFLALALSRARLFVDWGDFAIVEDRICFWIHRAVSWHKQAFLCVVCGLSLSFSTDILCEIEAVVVEARNRRKTIK